ncbi:HAD-IA family hydrolase [Kamptonema formosum]|uniref:HAD-IA family hydrolase n=1 Tax=Kamptonema formosum TaxID=331992 RepID=UPI000349A6D2|nr:HAD-IA family hydrolase [Oscillatoria sp. PCC 10802]
MTVKVILFDFDGTVADTLDTLVGITNRLAGEFGYEPTTKEEVETFKNLSSRQVIKQSRVSIFKLPFLIRKVKKQLSVDLPKVAEFSGMKEAIFQLESQGLRLGIVTSNSAENVKLFLKAKGLLDCFTWIQSEAAIFGKSQVLKRFMRANSLQPEEVIYVGDETRDIEAAQKSNIKGVAVSWGFNTRQVLEECRPDFLIDSPGELIDVIRSLQPGNS